ncbi:tripartite motif-containing protein 26-like, partial [Crocuta crocuta]
PVWQLASLVENIERLQVDKDRQPGDVAREQADGRLCERHREKLHYYCQDDGKLLCVMCRESREHRPHSAVLVEKAAQPHREKILNHLSTLRRDRDKIQGLQAKGEADILTALKKLQDQRQDIVAEFEQSHQFLRERERHLLDQLSKLEQELTEGREKYKTKGVAELARLALLISELEGKAQQPAAELMQVSDLPRAGQEAGLL